MQDAHLPVKAYLSYMYSTLFVMGNHFKMNTQ